MELNKCPNCSGKLELSPDRRKLICPYCGSEFALDEATSAAVAPKNGELIVKDWFLYDWHYDDLMETPKRAETINAFVKYLNEYDSSEKLEDYIKTYLFSNEDLSAPGIREDNLTGIKARISSYIEPGEHIVLYYDEGLFVHGKTGVVITEKRALFVEKKEVTSISYEKIPYIYFGYSIGLPEVKLGEKYANNIAPLGSNYDLLGAVTALICLFAFEKYPARPKIRLTGDV
ncbi:MAG: hypothetical protein K5669_06650 [Lachnospiraceae bacterium]|nr:hypothetical protein [Lachnospiraceae bacterium]